MEVKETRHWWQFQHIYKPCSAIDRLIEGASDGSVNWPRKLTMFLMGLISSVLSNPCVMYMYV